MKTEKGHKIHDGSGSAFGLSVYYAKIWGEWFEVSGELENSLCNNIPPHHYDKVDKDFLLKVTNLECLRVIRDKIGLGRYIELLGAKVIDEQTDHQGNKMRLFVCEEIGDKSILLEVVCPSTGRVFHLFPPNQSVKTCFEAKSSTFGDKPLAYRHGDVGLFDINNNGDITIPFSET